MDMSDIRYRSSMMVIMKASTRNTKDYFDPLIYSQVAPCPFAERLHLVDLAAQTRPVRVTPFNSVLWIDQQFRSQEGCCQACRSDSDQQVEPRASPG